MSVDTGDDALLRYYATMQRQSYAPGVLVGTDWVRANRPRLWPFALADYRALIEAPAELDPRRVKDGVDGLKLVELLPKPMRENWGEWRQVSPLEITRGAAHEYLSTGCLHEEHEYCQANRVPLEDRYKQPAMCKFCQAPCGCRCHFPPLPGRPA